ncbi:MAG: hypothetical protein ACOY4H_15780, partial [Thermodesulfobacteriota bacterium]
MPTGGSRSELSATGDDHYHGCRRKQAVIATGRHFFYDWHACQQKKDTSGDGGRGKKGGDGSLTRTRPPIARPISASIS